MTDNNRKNNNQYPKKFGGKAILHEETDDAYFEGEYCGQITVVTYGCLQHFMGDGCECLNHERTWTDTIHH